MYQDTNNNNNNVHSSPTVAHEVLRTLMRIIPYIRLVWLDVSHTCQVFFSNIPWKNRLHS